MATDHRKIDEKPTLCYTHLKPMTTVLSIIEIILGIFLIVVILLQQKGSGLGAAFGGASTVYSSKRGIEKTLHNITIVTAILFFGVGFLHLFI